MHVALISVGDEILAGDTVNTNATWLGQRLSERGVDVERVTVVPDVISEIASVVNEYHTAYDAVIITGGLGPTHDDLTMEGVAAALGREVAQSEEALAWLTEEGGYTRGDLTKGTADLPRGARPLHNDVGVAPGAVVEGIYVLPGVPSEMKAMFEDVVEQFEGEPRYVDRVYTSEPESALVPRLEALQERFDVSVGSYPGDGVRLKITGTDEQTVETAAEWIRERVELDE